MYPAAGGPEITPQGTVSAVCKCDGIGCMLDNYTIAVSFHIITSFSVSVDAASVVVYTDMIDVLRFTGAPHLHFPGALEVCMRLPQWHI